MVIQRPHRLTGQVGGEHGWEEMTLSPVGRQGQASKRESSAARELLGMACAVVAVGSKLDLSSSSTNQLSGLGLSSQSLSVLILSVAMATLCPRTS